MSSPTPAAASCSARHLLMRRAGGMDHQGLGVADIGEVGGEAQRLDEAPPRLAPAADAEADDRAGAAGQQAVRPGVIRMVGQAGIDDPGHRLVAGRKSRTADWVLATCRCHAQRQGLDALQDVESIGRDRQAPKSRRPSTRARMMKAGGPNCSAKTSRDSRHRARVSVGKLPLASQSKRPPSISTPPMATPWPPSHLVAECRTRSAPCSNGRLQTGRGEGVIDQQRDSGRVRDLGDGLGMSSTSSPGLPMVSREEQPRLRTDRRGEAGKVARRDEGGRRCRSAAGCAQQVDAAAIERGGGDDVAARAHQRGDGEMQRRLAAGGADGADAALQRRQPLLQHRRRSGWRCG